MCENLPVEILKFVKYVRSLKFEDKPSYSSIKTWLKKMVEKRGEEFDPCYDWVFKRLGHKIPDSAYADGFAPVIKKTSNRYLLKPEKIIIPSDEEIKY